MMENSNKTQENVSEIEKDVKPQEFLTNEGNESKILEEFVKPNISKDDSSKLDIKKFIQQEIEHVAVSNNMSTDGKTELTANTKDTLSEENRDDNSAKKDNIQDEKETSVPQIPVLKNTKVEDNIKVEDTKKDTISKDNLLINETEDKGNENTNEQKSSAKISEEKKDEESKPDKEQKASDEWEDILGSGSILKKKILAGAENSRPQRLDICTLKYKCTLEDGTLVEQEDFATIQLGDLEMVQGVELALGLMDIGEKCLLRIEPRLAFGSVGLDTRVPPDTPVLYELELVFAKPETDMSWLSIPERKAKGQQKKNRGNWWYSRGEYALAIQCYRRALDYLDEVEGGISDPLPDNDDPVQREMTDADLQSLMEDRINVSNNMAQAQLKLGAHDAALQSLHTVLRCQPNNVKALYRKAKILRDKNDIQLALICLNKAKQLAPENTSIQKEIQEINTILKKHKDHEKELARRMFRGQDPKQPKKGVSDNRSKTYIWATVVLSVAAGIAGVVAWRLKFS